MKENKNLYKINAYLLALVLSSISTLSLAQTSGNVTATTKASATLAAVCTIAAQNVNFGQISLPVGAQSATSSMTVQCTKGSSYTIGLAYGGVYGQGGVNVTLNNTFAQRATGGWTCTYSGSVNGQVVTQGPEYVYGVSYCPLTTPYSTASYNYGYLNGTAKGDTIAYSIQVPNNPGQVWNNGNYSYTTSGTGSNQSIPVVATLVPSQTTDKYPAADNYLDTVTATLSY